MHLAVAANARRSDHTVLRVLAWLAAAVVLTIVGVDVALRDALLIPVGWMLVSIAAAIVAAPLLRAMADDADA